MLDIQDVIDKYTSSISIRKDGDFVFVTPSFYHIDSDESIALRFSQTPDGRPIISDCGTTRDYLELRCITLNRYNEKLEAIKERFYLGEEDGAFIMEMPTESINSVKRHIGYFIQAISLIANIDL